jgi:hypothetical protein
LGDPGFGRGLRLGLWPKLWALTCGPGFWAGLSAWSFGFGFRLGRLAFWPFGLGFRLVFFDLGFRKKYLTIYPQLNKKYHQNPKGLMLQRHNQVRPEYGLFCSPGKRFFISQIIVFTNFFLFY